jgi:hypothetical protein
MPEAIRILAAAVFTAAVSVCAGLLLSRRLALKLCRGEELAVSFVAGSALLSWLVFSLAVLRCARPVVFLIAGAAIVAGALWRVRPAGNPLPDYPRTWKALFAAVFAVFTAIYLLHALAPECSPEGAAHHLALVGRYARDHGFLALPGSLPNGMHMLFLFGFVLGGHSAAALVHLGFLLALPFLMLAYARRAGLAKAGVFGALFTFVSPVAGADGASAHTHVAMATAVFTVFLLLRLWFRERRIELLAPIGLVALFAATATIGNSASGTAAPSLLEIPLEATILGGTLGGFIGPLYLMAPFAILALRVREGRILLLATVLAGAACPFDAGVRSLIPALPFLSLAMGVAFASTRVAAPALIVGHALLSLPNVAGWYCDAGAWRIESTWLRAALRLRPEESFLAARLPAYPMIRRLDGLVPEGRAVFSMSAVPAAYTSREILIDNRLSEALRIAVSPELRPTRHWRFAVPSQRLRAVRVRNDGAIPIHELRAFAGGREVARQTGWRLSGRPPAPDVQQAFDNSPVTFWAGKRLEVEFGHPVSLDAVVLESPPRPARFTVEALPESGAWTAARAAGYDDVPRPRGMRRSAIRELKARNIDYLLAPDSEPAGKDLAERPSLWGAAELARAGGFRLYRLR